MGFHSIIIRKNAKFDNISMLFITYIDKTYWILKFKKIVVGCLGFMTY